MLMETGTMKNADQEKTRKFCGTRESYRFLDHDHRLGTSRKKPGKNGRPELSGFAMDGTPPKSVPLCAIVCHVCECHCVPEPGHTQRRAAPIRRNGLPVWRNSRSAKEKEKSKTSSPAGPVRLARVAPGGPTGRAR